MWTILIVGLGCACAGYALATLLMASRTELEQARFRLYRIDRERRRLARWLAQRDGYDPGQPLEDQVMALIEDLERLIVNR